MYAASGLAGGVGVRADSTKLGDGVAEGEECNERATAATGSGESVNAFNIPDGSSERVCSAETLAISEGCSAIGNEGWSTDFSKTEELSDLGRG